MTHRERVLKTFRFEQTDRVPYDLMEGIVWPELQQYFVETHGLKEPDAVFEFLDTDFRWLMMSYVGPDPMKTEDTRPPGWMGTYSDALYKRPLADARTIADVEAHHWPDPAWWQPPDCEAARQRWPDHALVLMLPWMPLFCSACGAFGMEEALIKMQTEPHLFEAFVERQNGVYMDLLGRGLKAAEDICDFAWLADDIASKDALMMNPDLWRKLIKPGLAEQARLVHEHGMDVIFHSCGAVRSVLPDLIDIGVNCLLVFQTKAAGMDAESIAKEFGGRMVFYGGIDCQHILPFGTREEVRAEVRANVEAFADCSGYVVANSHHCIANIQPENMVAMCEAARQSTL